MFENARNINHIGFVKDSTIPVFELKERSAEEWNSIASGGAVNQPTEVTIEANGCSLAIKEYHGQRVVTLKDIDMVHQRPSGTADRNFRQNKKRFIEGEDFFHLSCEESRSTNFVERPNPKGINVFTQMGYLMLVKSFNDDLAWHIQRQLVNSYFMIQQQSDAQSAMTPQPATPESALSDCINWLIYLLEKQVKSPGADSVPLLPEPKPPTALALPDKRYNPNALGEATEFLLELLSSGKKPSKEVHAAANVRGISETTLDRAKEALQINCKERKGYGADMVVYWELPNAKVYNMDELKKEKLLTKDEAAFYCRVSIPTLDRAADYDPNFNARVRIGHGRGRVFFNRELLDQWLDGQAGKLKN